jgi:hypothetical protein
MRARRFLALSLATTLALAAASSAAQAPAPVQDSFMLTIFLRHDQSKTLDEI